MGELIFVCFVIFVVFQIVRAVRRNALPGQGVQSVGALDRLEASGQRARGLVLTCSPYVIGVTLNQRRFERRTMTLDVEIPGTPPYQSSGDFLIPRGLVEAIPGASLDLAVDPSDPDKIAVLGPGGFTGPWLRLGPPLPY